MAELVRAGAFGPIRSVYADDPDLILIWPGSKFSS
jgi:hypothetical protein